MAAVRVGGKRVGTLTTAAALALATLMLLLLVVAAVQARQLVVGDGYHWQAPPPNDSRFYQEWADKVSPITVGDSMTFILESGSYSVYQVNQTGFAACNSSQGREVAHGGGGAPTSVPFRAAGPLYFIDPAHCAQGMLFQILVNPLPVHPETSGPVKPHRGVIDASRYVSTSVIAALAAAAGIAILCILAGFIWCAFYKTHTRSASPQQQQHDLESSSGSSAATVDKYDAAGPHHTLRSPPMFSATETDQRIVLSASQRARSFTSAGPGASPLCVPAATAAAAAARVFSFRELSDATSGFAREFVLSDGGGAQGATVYRARVYIKEWEAMRDLAISRPSWPAASGGKINRQEVRRVKAEVGVLASVRHRNVARLLGWSWHREGNAGAESSSPLCLVYEFGARGGVLADYLFNGSSSSKRRRSVSSGHISGGGIEMCDGARQFKFLDWSARLQIAIDTARGLDYLHNWAHPIVHGAVCADNVWIDVGLHAKVANFGLHNLFAGGSGGGLAVGAPTAGYHADDAYTDVSDVYGFGVLLLTLLTSQKPCGSNNASFVDPFLNFLADSAALDCILDPELKQSATGAAVEEAAAWADWAQEMTVVAKIAAACLVNRAESRPSMRDVLFLLENVRVDRTLPPYREVRDPHRLHQVAPPPPTDWTITNT